YEVGPFQLHADQLLLTCAGSPVALGPKVVETLLALVEHPGEVLAKAALLDRIWPEGFVEEANLAQNVHVLRKTFRAFGSADPIETVPRRGYCLRAPVRRIRAAAAPAAVRESGPARRIAGAFAGAAFVALSLVLVPSDGSNYRPA